jgi:hypothetical protein
MKTDKESKHETPELEAKTHSKKYLISALRKEDPKLVIANRKALAKAPSCK